MSTCRRCNGRFAASSRARKPEELIDTLRQVYPDADADREGDQDEPPPEARTVIDGADYERFQADQLWRRIRALPFEDQKWHIRGYLFHSTVLFDLLRTRSREEGRQDRELGVRIAELALVSLERHEEIFGERIYDLRALGWAWLANARRLMFDLEEAAADLVRADHEWSVPRAEKDLAIAAELRLLEAGLRTYQRRYDEALELLGESLRLSRLTGNLTVQTQALMQRASVSSYMDKCETSIADLRSALNIDHGDPYLTFIGNLNLVAILARLGCCKEAAKAVSSVRKLSSRLGPSAQHQVEWLDAIVKHGLGERRAAEKLYSEALYGFASLGEFTSVALITLDMSIFCFEEHRRVRAASLARKAVPILQTLKLGRETLTAVELLAKALEANKVTELLVREIKQCLNKDPLVQPWCRVGKSSFPTRIRGN